MITIDSPKALLALSLTSQEWTTMILLNHIRYRELQIRVNRSEIWKHLATRTDLSKNIRKVYLIVATDHRHERLPFPSSKPHGQATFLAEDIHYVIQTLSHFESMTSFTWMGSRYRCPFIEEILGALTHCHKLVELVLGDICPRIGRDRLNPESLAPNCGANVIEYDDDLIANHLIIDFLFAHPTIQDLYWDPFGIPILPQGLLPSLKHLSTNNELVNALLRDNTLIKSRALEAITRISLNPNTIELLEMINGSRLQKATLGNFGPEGLKSVHRLGVLFPTIKTLIVPRFGVSGLIYTLV